MDALTHERVLIWREISKKNAGRRSKGRRLARAPESRDRDLPSFPGRGRGGKATFPPLIASRKVVGENFDLSGARKGGNAAFPPSLVPGEEGTRRSPLSPRREGRERGVPSSHLFGKGFPRAGEEGTWPSLLSGRAESGEDGVPSSPFGGKGLRGRGILAGAAGRTKRGARSFAKVREGFPSPAILAATRRKFPARRPSSPPLRRQRPPCAPASGRGRA